MLYKCTQRDTRVHIGHGLGVGWQWNSMDSEGFSNRNNSEILRTTPAPSPATKILLHKPNTIL